MPQASHKLLSRSQVVIRRRPLFYVVSLLLPSIFLMVMDIVGFYLPPNSGERVSFKITLLLGYSVFLIIVSDTLPATAIGTPLIGKVSPGSRAQSGEKPTPSHLLYVSLASALDCTGVYFVVCMALLVISLAETIFIVRLVHKQDLQQPVPAWLRHLVLERIAWLLCLREQSTSQRPPATSQATKTDDCSGEKQKGRVHTRGRFWLGCCGKFLEGVACQGGAVLHMASHALPYWEGQTSAKGVSPDPFFTYTTSHHLGY